MISAPLLALALPLLPVLPLDPIADPGPVLAIKFNEGNIVAKVTGPSPDFLGAVIVSDREELTHFLVVLPPLLSNFVILGVGQAQNGSLDLVVPHGPLPPVELKIFAQGVTLDAGVLASSDVQTLIMPDGQPGQ